MKLQTILIIVILAAIVAVAGCTQAPVEDTGDESMEVPAEGHADVDEMVVADDAGDAADPPEEVPACTENADCNDNEDCTTDVCDAGSCLNTAVPSCQVIVEEAPTITAISADDADETITLTGKTAKVEGWILRVDDMYNYTFGVGKTVNREIVVHLGLGFTSSQEWYMGVKSPVLEDNSTVVLYDAAENVISRWP